MKRKKLGFYDGLFLFAALAAFFVVALDLRFPLRTAGEEPVYLTLKTEALPIGAAEAIPNEAAFSLDGRYTLTPIGAEILPATGEIATADGRLVFPELPDRRTVILTLFSEGRRDSAGVYLGVSRFVAPNMTLTLSGERVRFSATVTEIGGKDTRIS